MMNWIIENWLLIIGATALITIGGCFIVKFFKVPTKEQIENIKQWLIYACIEAEKELGSKTGQVKLRLVYDKFISKFAGISSLISFKYFCVLVDEALKVMKKMLENPAIAKIVQGGTINEPKTANINE